MGDDTRDPGPDEARDDRMLEPGVQARRVQVVDRWNSWVRVYDPTDGSLTWVDLARARYAPA